MGENARPIRSTVQRVARNPRNKKTATHTQTQASKPKAAAKRDSPGTPRAHGLAVGQIAVAPAALLPALWDAPSNLATPPQTLRIDDANEKKELPEGRESFGPKVQREMIAEDQGEGRRRNKGRKVALEGADLSPLADVPAQSLTEVEMNARPHELSEQAFQTINKYVSSNGMLTLNIGFGVTHPFDGGIEKIKNRLKQGGFVLDESRIERISIPNPSRRPHQDFPWFPFSYVANVGSEQQPYFVAHLQAFKSEFYL